MQTRTSEQATSIRLTSPYLSLAFVDPDTKVSPSTKCLDGNRTRGKPPGAAAVPAPFGRSAPKQRCTPPRRDARARRHQTARGTGPVEGARGDRRTALEPSCLARDASGPRRRLRTPPARLPAPPADAATDKRLVDFARPR
uniref:Uncharacterized protein n=1 Tax=Arundo donax TaxID=35708 RepID=A0A0A9G0B5_ARUDO